MGDRSSAAVLPVAIAVALLASSAAQADVALTREGERIVVAGDSYRAVVDPADGGRIVSLQQNGVELTHVGPDGHGGLFEEANTADYPYAVLSEHSDGDEALVVLATEANGVRIVKHYRFPADGPTFTVEITCENRSPFAASGATAPAVRHLLLPAGRSASGRELYCLDRGRGAEVLSPDVLMAQLRDGRTSGLRWMAVADPAARRAVGLCLLDGGACPLPPRRTGGRGVLLGWSSPPVPPGCSVTMKALVVLLDGFSAVAGLTDSFAAETLADRAAGQVSIRLDVMPLTEAMRDISVITRAYDSGGREVEPYDPVLFPDLPALRRTSGVTAWPGTGEKPALLVHEMYESGRRVGSFTTSLAPAFVPDLPAPNVSPPTPVPLPNVGISTPGGLIAPDAAAVAEGFVLWRFDGPPARRQLTEVAVALTRGSRRSVFLGLRALKPLADVRATMAAAPTADPRVSELPPGAVSLWQIEGPDTAAELVPHSRLSLAEGQCAWLGLTVNAEQLRPGRYGARLAVRTNGSVRQVPVDLRVYEEGLVDADSFGLWYLPSQAPADGWEAVLPKLRAYGVSAACLPMVRGAPGGPLDEIASKVQRVGLTLVGSSHADGALPPPMGRPMRVLLACSRPVWLLDACAARPTAPAATVGAGYVPAALCERLSNGAGAAFAAAGAIPFWLVEGGCEPGRVPAMVADGTMKGDETVWLFLDLAGQDWRQAATEVRSAAWAAAWQGLGGLAVRLPVPARQVDRQSVLWHIVRDACHEARAWRTAGRRAAAGSSTAPAPAATAAIERTVGTDDACSLRVGEVRRPFRNLYRVMRSDGLGPPDLARFEGAYATTLRSAAALPAERAGDRSLYWDGTPVIEDGLARAVIVAAEGETVWKEAVALQQALAERTGQRVPVSRAFPSPLPSGTRMVIALAGETVPAGWPEIASTARTAANGSGAAVAELEGGAQLLVIGLEADSRAFLAALRAEPGLFPPSRNVR